MFDGQTVFVHACVNSLVAIVVNEILVERCIFQLTVQRTLIDSELVNGEMICALVGLRDGRMGNRGCFEKEIKYNLLHVLIDRSIYIS